MAEKARARGRLADALWMWFAFLGGAMAWILHLGSAWGITETTCLSGHSRIDDIPLSSVIKLATIVPLLVALAATGAAWVMWRRTDAAHIDDSTPRGGRAHLLAGVGLAANLLFIAIIVFDGVALAVFPSCQA